MDPLGLLRESCIAGTLGSITESDDRIQFGNRYSFPKVTHAPFACIVARLRCAAACMRFERACRSHTDVLVQDVPTAYKSQQGGLYTLSTLLFFLKNRGLAVGQYLAAATKAGVASVGFRDRKARHMQAPSPLSSLAWTCWWTCRDSASSGSLSTFQMALGHLQECLASSGMWAPSADLAANRYTWSCAVNGRSAELLRRAVNRVQDVEAYLSGASDRSDSIVLTAPDLLPLQPPLDAADQAAGAEPAAKRARTDSAAAPGAPSATWHAVRCRSVVGVNRAYSDGLTS